MRSFGPVQLFGLVLVMPWLGACRAEEPAPSTAAATPAPTPAATLAPAPPRAAPKPGERVRQPELDGYCDDAQRPAAFYYHGGTPAVRVARKDACAPLYLTECEAEGRCYPPRDQEPGMWCCSGE